MYIVAIAWVYITLLMAAAERNFVSGAMTFMVYGLGPLALFLWLFGTPQRARNRALRAMQQARKAEADSPGEGTVPPA